MKLLPGYRRSVSLTDGYLLSKRMAITMHMCYHSRDRRAILAMLLESTRSGQSMHNQNKTFSEQNNHLTRTRTIYIIHTVCVYMYRESTCTTWCWPTDTSLGPGRRLYRCNFTCSKGEHVQSVCTPTRGRRLYRCNCICSKGEHVQSVHLPEGGFCTNIFYLF